MTFTSHLVDHATILLSPWGVDLEIGLRGEEDSYEFAWAEVIASTLTDLAQAAQVDTPENARLNYSETVSALRAAADAIEAAGLSAFT